MRLHESFATATYGRSHAAEAAGANPITTEPTASAPAVR